MGVGKTKIVGISIELSAVRIFKYAPFSNIFYYRRNIVGVVPAVPNQVSQHYPILALSVGPNRGILALSSLIFGFPR